MFQKLKDYYFKLKKNLKIYTSKDDELFEIHVHRNVAKNFIRHYSEHLFEKITPGNELIEYSFSNLRDISENEQFIIDNAAKIKRECIGDYCFKHVSIDKSGIKYYKNYYCQNNYTFKTSK